jgi:TM2 domain-containing membrane protein YozV
MPMPPRSDGVPFVWAGAWIPGSVSGKEALVYKDASIIDLGDLDAPARAARPGAQGPRAPRPQQFQIARPAAATHFAPRGDGFFTSLSLFLPGTGQVLLGEPAYGLFFFSSIAFLATLGWAILTCLDRLMRTLDLFGIPDIVLPTTLLVLYALIAVLHLSGVLHAYRLVPRPDRPGHPILSALASLLVPGWGQMRNGCYGRGALFLGSLWVFAAAGIMVSGALQAFDSLAPGLNELTGTMWFKASLLTGPAVAWTLAVYDAAAYARGHRAQ